MEYKYEFTITMYGDGENPDEAWKDAIEAISLDPGDTPEDYELFAIYDE